MAIQYTAELGPLGRFRDGLALKVRQRVFDIFMRECAPAPTARVADFGVSGHDDHPAHTFFERLYPHRENLTVIGRAAEDARWFPERFPGLTFLEADLRAIPLPDDHFEAGLCNAVVEHAGSRAEQEALVREVCRVCRTVVFTTPNRGFPVELHTFLPLLHWLPDDTYRKIYRALGRDYFAREENLNPLYAANLLALASPERLNTLLKVGPPVFATNLVLVSRKRAGGRE